MDRQSDTRQAVGQFDPNPFKVVSNKYRDGVTVTVNGSLAPLE
jgi:hypothetical protein